MGGHSRDFVTLILTIHNRKQLLLRARLFLLIYENVLHLFSQVVVNEAIGCSVSQIKKKLIEVVSLCPKIQYGSLSAHNRE